MSILHITKEEQETSVFISIIKGKVYLEFSCNGGKHGTNEMLDGYTLTPERLLNILQDRKDYKEDEI